MATFRNLLEAIQGLSDSQLDQEVVIIPSGYCSAAPLEINGYSAFSGSVEIAIAKGDIVYDETPDGPYCGCGTEGVLDLGELDSEAKAEMEDAEVILPAGAAYIRIGE